MWPHVVLDSVKITTLESKDAEAFTLTFKSSTVLLRLEPSETLLGTGCEVLVEAMDEHPSILAGQEVEVPEVVQGWQNVMEKSCAASSDYDLCSVKSEVVARSEASLMQSAERIIQSPEKSAATAVAILAPELIQQRMALATVSGRLASGLQFALCQADGQQDITTMTESVVERALRERRPLPGWDYKGDPKEHLAYLKVFFDVKNMNYRAGTLWDTAEVPKKIMVKLEELGEHMKLFLANDVLLQSLGERARYDLQVANVWLNHVLQNKVPHGPLLGWGLMREHELYEHEHAAGQKPFLMVRSANQTWDEQRSWHLVTNLCCFVNGVTKLF